MASEKLSLFPGPENSGYFFPGYHWAADSRREVRRLPVLQSQVSLTLGVPKCSPGCQGIEDRY